MKVAIDGPAGSGKSTVCKILASKYNLTYLDTGAMYRAVAYCSYKYGDEYLGDKLRDVEFIFANQGKSLTLKIDNNSIDVTDEIRTPHISSIVSKVASIKEVRDILTKKQQEIARNINVIMEGRDITTVVFPNAEVKIYLTADASERANRRYKELIAKGIDTTYEATYDSIMKRDENDMKKEMGALKIAEDAVVIDSTEMSIEEVYEKVVEIITNTELDSTDDDENITVKINNEEQ